MGDGGRAEGGGIGNCTLAVGIVKVMNEITSRTCGIRPKRKSRGSQLSHRARRGRPSKSVSAQRARDRKTHSVDKQARNHTHMTQCQTHTNVLYLTQPTPRRRRSSLSVGASPYRRLGRSPSTGPEADRSETGRGCPRPRPTSNWARRRRQLWAARGEVLGPLCPSSPARQSY